MVKLKRLQLLLLLTRVTQIMVMLVVQIESHNLSLLMFHKWTTFQQTILHEEKSAIEETQFLKVIIWIKKIQNKQLIKKVGIIVETLESFYPMGLLKLLIVRKIFTNWVKVSMLLLKRFKTFIWDLLMLLNVSFMATLYKTTMLLLFTPILIFFLLWQKNLVLMKLMLKVWLKIKK